ncbi:MAG: LD-carboxypeptidase [Muribaculaceae bacterium]|nr:LD-carboxypeptidase [Muribaculaceae bacterium]
MLLQTPPLLSRGDTIALLSPASAIDPALLDGAAAAIASAGYRPMIMPGAKGCCGSFSASATRRLADLQAAVDNPAVKAIVCGRGGYGAVHLLDRLRLTRPVWLAGFSDISALHALWHINSFRSIHSSMAKELTRSLCPGNEANLRLFEILRTGHMPPIQFDAHPLNRPGTARGTLHGGNLAVLDGLVGTPFDLLTLPDTILVIEDIAEPIYKVERMLWRLKLAGVFDRLKGLVVGQFTDYRPSADWADMYSMIASAVGGYSFPVAFNAPIGHIDANLPFVQGASVCLAVGGARSVVAEGG